MISGHCWKVASIYNCELCPGSSIGQCFRYADPVDSFLGCPGNFTKGDDGTSIYRPVDPRTCQDYLPDCANMGGDGDDYMWHRFMRGCEPPVTFDYYNRPTRWLLPPIGYGGGVTALAINQMLADNLVNVSTWTPGATDLPPEWPWDGLQNGWAGYPARISIRYYPLPSYVIRDYIESGEGVYNPDNPEHKPDFQVAVYNMRGDLIGGSGGHIESGEPISLSYPTTSHGGETGDIMWDLGAIKFSTRFIQYISSIRVEVSALGSQNVGTVVIIGPGNTAYNLLINTSGGGLHGIHAQTAENVPLTVHLQITESELV